MTNGLFGEAYPIIGSGVVWPIIIVALLVAVPLVFWFRARRQANERAKLAALFEKVEKKLMVS
jgi:hypothetical protein